MASIWVLIAVSIASLVKGITGFGFALFSLPILLFWYPIKELIPILIICNLFASIIIVLQKKERPLVNNKFKILIGIGGLFTIFGTIALEILPERELLIGTTIFIILLSVLSFVKVKAHIRLRNSIYIIAGIVCGFLTGAISVSGPPLALFLNAAKVDNQEFREIFSWFSIVTTIVALIGYYSQDMLNMNILNTSIQFFPILYIGSFIGKRLNQFIPVDTFRNISIIICLISAVTILLKV